MLGNEAYPCDEWIITSIKKPNTKRILFRNDNNKSTFIYLTQKNDCTWVKRSRTNFDYGFAKNIDKCFKYNFSLEKYESDGLPLSFAFTKSDAYKKELKFAERQMNKCTYDDEKEDWKKGISKLKRLLTMESKKKVKMMEGVNE